MYINAIPFSTTISMNIQLGYAQAIPDQTHKSINNALRKIVKIYTNFGFRITHILGDGEFEHLDPSVILLGVPQNIVANDEHVPEIERYIRTIKEQTISF